MKLGKIYLNKNFVFMMIAFFIISYFSINSATKLLPSFYKNLPFKQTLWYILGFGSLLFIMYIKNEKLLENIWLLYIVGNVLLIGLLLFAPRINDAKCWFFIPGIGGIQPSEFMKIILILLISVKINNFHQKYPYPTIKQEFMFLINILFLVAIPSVLTFLQPDTGVVLIYLIITFFMLFISGIRYQWFLLLFVLIIILVALLLGFYFFYQEQFVNVFGSSFFLRIDRLLNWSNSSGYQLENGRSAIGAGGLFGYGFNNTPIYFPEPQTDFIFATYASNTGFIGSTILIILIICFDISLILVALKSKKLINKYIIAGIIGMLIYQQIQNISMTIGLMPITGLTLPFISYGGSSLLSYFIVMAIVFNISNEQMQKNK